MKCVDCGKDAVCLSDTSQIIHFAFCYECAIKRMDNKFCFVKPNINVDDLFVKMFAEAKKQGR